MGAFIYSIETRYQKKNHNFIKVSISDAEYDGIQLIYHFIFPTLNWCTDIFNALNNHF